MDSYISKMDVGTTATTQSRMCRLLLSASRRLYDESQQRGAINIDT